MSDDESFDEFYTKLNDIVNSAYNLGEIYDQPKIVRKILRSLTENFMLSLMLFLQRNLKESQMLRLLILLGISSRL